MTTYTVEALEQFTPVEAEGLEFESAEMETIEADGNKLV
jgi:hypothetical protein